MRLLDGKELSEKILTNLKREIKKSNLKLRLAIVQVGENLVSQIFINQKKKACEKVGINLRLFKFPVKVSVLKLKKEIKKIVRNPANSGIIIQLPLPKKFQGPSRRLGGWRVGWSPEEFLNLISEEKDIDVLSEKSLGKFY